MKKMLILMLLVAGCQQGNLTWTPTAEEWATMTPEQRNAWSANELAARQARDEAWQRMWQGFQQVEIPEREVTIIPNYQPAPKYNPYTQEEIYYRRKNLEESRKLVPMPRVNMEAFRSDFQPIPSPVGNVHTLIVTSIIMAK